MSIAEPQSEYDSSMHSKYRSDTSINPFEALTAYSRRNHRGTRAEYFNVVSIFYTSIISRYHSLTWLNLNRSTDRPSQTSQHLHYIQADRVIFAHQLDTASIRRIFSYTRFCHQHGSRERC